MRWANRGAEGTVTLWPVVVFSSRCPLLPVVSSGSRSQSSAALQACEICGWLRGAERAKWPVREPWQSCVSQ